MKLTTEQLKDLRDAIDAHMAGKMVQYFWNNKWIDTSSPTWETHIHAYRPKPEPKTRPWSKPEDVPGPVCWVKRKRDGVMCLVVEMFSDYIVLGERSSGKFPWSELVQWEYSTDRKTWHPCEVTEE